jgi:DNA-binding response OmpR family regulator
MRLLLAEDNAVMRILLESLLREWGYEVVAVSDGTAAWRELQSLKAPELVLLDWLLPGLSGLEICRNVRQAGKTASTYILLMTGRAAPDDLIQALEAGADDYLVKPFEPAELRLRLQVAGRILNLQARLGQCLRELEESRCEDKQLHGLLPICSYCKRIKDGRNSWRQIEAYISTHSAARFSHSICPACYESVVRPELQALAD